MVHLAEMTPTERSLVRPDDEHNRALVGHVHPADWVNPKPAEGKYNLVVIGGGSAGLVSAAGTAGLGGRVALIERHLLGGDCLNSGCVPSKALISAARVAAAARRAAEVGVVTGEVRVDFAAVMERMRRLRASIAPHDSAARFRDLGVDVFLGEGRFVGRHEVEVDGARLRFARAVIATGARAWVPPIPGLDEAGYLTSDTVFELTELPRRLVVIGAGPIGCELAQSVRRFGAEVTVIDRADRILPRDDIDAAAVVAEALAGEGVELLLGAAIERVEDDRTVVATIGEESRRIPADAILVATGRRTWFDGLGLDAAGVRTDDRGRLVLDRKLRTTNKHIFAAGDASSQHQFTHAADAMARMVLRNALFPFGRARVDRLIIPHVTYTEPEIAGVGITAAEAAERGVAIDTFEQPLTSVDRAIVDGSTEGFVRVHVLRGSDRIVGATIVSPHAGELISEIVLAMTSELGFGAIGNSIHAYPTEALAIRQAADQYSRTRLKPWVAKLFRWMLRWRRR